MDIQTIKLIIFSFTSQYEENSWDNDWTQYVNSISKSVSIMQGYTRNIFKQYCKLIFMKVVSKKEWKMYQIFIKILCIRSDVMSYTTYYYDRRWLLYKNIKKTF